MAGAFALLAAGSASATQTGTSPYTGSGNWVVSTPMVVTDETIDVGGSILVSSTFDLTNVTIRFTVNGSSLTILAPGGGMTLQPGAGSALITTANPLHYWSFAIANTSANVNIQNATLDRVLNGVTVNGGTAAARYFAYVTVTHAVNFGFRLTDSYATLLKINVSMDFNIVKQRRDWATSLPSGLTCLNRTYNYTGSGYYYGQTYTYHCIVESWSAGATGVSVTGGGPWFDGIEVHIPSLNQRIDVALEGGFVGFYDFIYYYAGTPCYGLQYRHYWYTYNYTYHYFTPFLSFNGTLATGASFALFKDVKPPTEDLFIDLHYNLVGGYTYSYDYCGYSPSVTYTSPGSEYSFNWLQWTTADVIGIKVINGGIGSTFNDLDLSMGKTGILITSDWTAAATYQNAWLTSYGRFPTPNVYAFWSNETYALPAPSAVTRTDFTIRNSKASGAGMRFDRVYAYTAAALPNGAADTVFRGVVTIDNLTATNIAGTALDLGIYAYATATPNKFDYTVRVTDSYISAFQHLSIVLPNMAVNSTNYTADVLIEGNTFRDGLVRPPSSIPTTGYTYNVQFPAAIMVDTGWHAAARGSDWYKVNIVVRNNIISNISGTVFSWPYSDFTFAGGSSLSFEGNTFRDIRFYAAPGAAAPTPSQGGDMIHTIADKVSFVGNTFDQVNVAFGITGAFSGPNPLYPYYPFALCAYYMIQIGYNYWYYGCSWASKVPVLTVESNSFNGVTTPTGSPVDAAFFALPGHAKLTFNNNTVTASSAKMVNAFLYFYTPTYKFAVESIDVTAMGNTIRGQTVNAVFSYVDPYQVGNAFRMVGNDMRDSQAPLFNWYWGYYASLSASYRPTENFATIVVSSNVMKNISVPAGAALRVTGRATVINNTFEDIVGWGLITEFMSKIPVLPNGNQMTNVTNGYWLAPIQSAMLQTVTFSNLAIPSTGTSIRVENANLILVRVSFGAAITPVSMVRGHADIYSSALAVGSASVSNGGSVSVYNEVGFSFRWADAQGRDSGVPVANAALVTSSAEHKILSSARSDAQGHVAKRQVLVWEKYSFGSSAVETTVYAPFEILVSASGISQTVMLPNLGPGEPLTTFQDYPDYPVLVIDSLIPSISIGSPSPGATLGTYAVTVEGHSFERGSGLSAQRVRIDDGAWVDLPADQSTTWKVTMGVSGEGTHTIYGEVRDRAGNSFTAQTSFIVDLTPPSLQLLHPIDLVTYTNKEVYTVQGHVEPRDSELDINGIAVVARGTGDFFLDYTLLDGLNVMFITAQDIAGNKLTVVRTIVFDRYAPFLQVTAPVDGLLTNVKRLDIVGRAEPGSTVTVNGNVVTMNPVDGTFTLPNFELLALFAQTENVIVIRARDSAGNVAYDNRTVTVDTKAPKIELELEPELARRIAAGLPVSVNSIDIKGKTDSADAILTVGSQRVTLQGFSFSRVIVLAEGPNTVEVKALDEVGNMRVVTLRIVRDTTKPTLTIEQPKSDWILTNQRTLDIRGLTDSSGSTVYIAYTNAVGAPIEDPVPAVPVGLPIQYRFEHVLNLVPDGNAHVVSVRVVDPAGNEATQTFTYTAKVSLPSLQLQQMVDTTSETYVWVNGTTDLGITKVTINGQVFDVVDQFFSVRWNLPVASGPYTFRVTVVDGAGNAQTTTATVMVTNSQTVTPVTANPGMSPEFLAGAGLALLGVAVAVLFVAMSRRKPQ